MNGESLTEQPDFENIRWTTLDRDDFRELYWQVVAPRLEQQGRDPQRDRPTYDWFRKEGLRSFIAALRRHQDRTLVEFWTEDLGLSDESREDSSRYAWATGDKRTREALETFLDSRRTRHGLKESSIEALRRRLNLYVRCYHSANGTDELLTPVARDSNVPPHRAVDACWAAFDYLNEAEYSARTRIRVRAVVDSWYQHLVARRLASLNPATGLYDEFKWQIDESDPGHLDAGHVRALVDAVESTRERLLVVALAAWGLRASEVASLHVDQFVRKGDVPYIRFEERKNGPGEVSVLYGLSVLDDRISQLERSNADGWDHESITDTEVSSFETDRSESTWNGYLFPSRQSASGHVSRKQIWYWFRTLAERAGLPTEIDGDRPSPQLCRRFWYDTYTSVLEGVLAGIEDVAAEQGSADPSVVMSNYLSNERARTVRREFMRTRLAEAFEPLSETSDN